MKKQKLKDFKCFAQDRVGNQTHGAEFSDSQTVVHTMFLKYDAMTE